MIQTFKRLKFFKLLIVMLSFTGNVFSGEGSLDTTFGTNGVKITPHIGGGLDPNQINALAIQQDNKIIAAGQTSAFFGSSDIAIARYNAADGSLDSSFGTGGIVTTDVQNFDAANDVAIDANQKIVIAGTSSTGAVGSSQILVARYNTNGTLDTTFNPLGTGSGIPGVVLTTIQGNDQAQALIIQPDGKIVVAGGSTTGAFGGTTSFALARYNTDGSLDTTFNGTGTVLVDFGVGTQSNAYDLIIQPDGKLVAAGITNANGSSDFALIRLNTDGSIDTSFGTAGKVITDFGTLSDDAARSLALQADGKLVVSGYSDVNGTYDFALARYNTNGTLDTTFNSAGALPGTVTTTFPGSSDNSAETVLIQPNGKIVAIGYSDASGSYDFALARYDINGALDSTFGTGGLVLTDFATTINPLSSPSTDFAYAGALQEFSTGRIIAGGNTNASETTTDFGLAAYLADVIAPTITITSPANGSITNDNQPLISGTTEPSISVQVLIDGNPIGSTTSDIAGNWQVATPVALSEGVHTVLARATDAAGNIGTDTISFTVDTQAPTLIITSPANNSITNDNQPLITGTTEAGLTVQVSIDGNPIGSAVADIAGVWSIQAPSPLSDGVHTVGATTQDAAGNIATTTNTFTVDTQAPTLIITSPANNSVINDNTPLITGQTEANLTVQLSIDGNSIGSTVADSLGLWSFQTTVPLSEGLHVVSATTQDAAGNIATTSNTFTVDTAAPLITIVSPENGSIVSTNQPLITGETEPGLTVQVSVDGVNIGSVVADANGIWTIQSPVLSEGQHIIVAITQDSAGNIADDTSTFTVDTSEPSIIITQPQNGDVLTTPVITIRGTTTPGREVTVLIDGVVIGTVIADDQGNWSIVSPRLTNGNHTITAIIQDEEGNLISTSIIITINAAQCVLPADRLSRAIRNKYF